MPDTPVLTAARLRQILEYDPQTGLFRRLPGLRKHFTLSPDDWFPGARQKKGHWEIRLNERTYQTGRLAWVLMTGRWPPKQVDHINLDGLDNRWENLRLATHAENQRNARPRPLKGASWHKHAQKWRAVITVDDRQIHLGYFETAEEAHDAYREASAKYHGKFGRT